MILVYKSTSTASNTSIARSFNNWSVSPTLVSWYRGIYQQPPRQAQRNDLGHFCYGCRWAHGKGAWWCTMWDFWYYDICLYAWIRLIHKILWYIIWIHNMIWFMQTLDLCMSSISHPQAIRTPLLNCSRQLLRDLNEEVTVWTGPRVSHLTSSPVLRNWES